MIISITPLLSYTEWLYKGQNYLKSQQNPETKTICQDDYKPWKFNLHRSYKNLLSHSNTNHLYELIKCPDAKRKWHGSRKMIL